MIGLAHPDLGEAVTAVVVPKAPIDEAAIRTALGDLAGRATIVPRQPAEAHMPAVIAALQAALARSPGAHLLLTGRAQAIQGVRAACKAGSLPSPAATRAYWSLGKAGLD